MLQKLFIFRYSRQHPLNMIFLLVMNGLPLPVSDQTVWCLKQDDIACGIRNSGDITARDDQCSTYYTFTFDCVKCQHLLAFCWLSNPTVVYNSARLTCSTCIKHSVANSLKTIAGNVCMVQQWHLQLFPNKVLYKVTVNNPQRAVSTKTVGGCTSGYILNWSLWCRALSWQW